MIRCSIVVLLLVAFAGLLEAQPAIKGKEVATVPGQISSFHVSPDGAYAAASVVRIKLDKDGNRGGDGDEIVVWDLATGQQKINSGKNDLVPVGFSANGKELITAGRMPFDITDLQVWDLESGKAAKAITLAQKAYHPRLSADKTTLFGITEQSKAGEHTVETWDVATGISAASFKFDSGRIAAYQPLDKGGFLAVVETAPRTMGLLTRDAKTGKTTTKDLPGANTGLIASDGKLIVGWGDQGFKV